MFSVRSTETGQHVQLLHALLQEFRNLHSKVSSSRTRFLDDIAGD